MYAYRPAGASSPAFAQPTQRVVYAQPQVAPAAPLAFAQPTQQFVYGQQVLYGDSLFRHSPPFALPPTISPLLLSKLKQYEGHWKAVKPELESMFNQMCPGGQANLSQMVAFFDCVGRKFLGQGIGSFMTEEIYERFDFNGDGVIEWKEGYKCLKRVSTQILHENGHAVDTNVPFKTPQQGGYTIIKELARGGQGAALLARHPRLGECCVKEYDKGNANAGGIEELIAEMDHLKALQSPLIMATYEIFQDSGHYYSVFELLPGGDMASFRQKCTQNGIQLSEPLFRGVFLQCVQALDFIHRHGVLHCDIKEPNVMIKNKDYRNAQICLIDFGLAQDAAGAAMSGGTPGYTPPETCVPPNKWFPRGDIFSMGVVFFQLLADKVPDDKTGKLGIFQEGYTGNIDEITYFTTTRQPPFQLIQGTFPGTVGFLSKMLAKRRKQRPKPAQLLEDPWFTNEGFSTQPTVGTIRVTPPLQRVGTAPYTPGGFASGLVSPSFPKTPMVGTTKWSPPLYNPAATPYPPGPFAGGVVSPRLPTTPMVGTTPYTPRASANGLLTPRLARPSSPTRVLPAQTRAMVAPPVTGRARTLSAW